MFMVCFSLAVIHKTIVLLRQMKSLRLIFLILCFASVVCAQGTFPVKNYLQNLKIINPAYNGFNGNHFASAQVGFRDTKLNNYPLAGIISYEGTINRINTSIGGLFSRNRAFGITQTNYATYLSHSLSVKEFNIRVGAELDLISRTIDFNRLVFSSQFSPFLTSQFSPFPIGILSDRVLSISIGSLISYNNYILGVSYKNLNSPRFNFSNEMVSNLPQTLSIVAGYTWSFNKLEVKPLIIYRHANLINRVDFDAEIIFDKLVKLGLIFQGIDYENPRLVSNLGIILFNRLQILSTFTLFTLFENSSERMSIQSQGTELEFGLFLTI